jgi:hypothetical protein
LSGIQEYQIVKDYLQIVKDYLLKNEKKDIKPQINPNHQNYFRGKSKVKMSETNKEWKFDEEWQTNFIEPFTTCKNVNWELIEWVIVKKWNCVLEIVRYMGIYFPEDWVFIKDPSSYENIAHIIKKRDKKGWSSHGIIFLLTKEFVEIHSIVKEIGEGMIFYNHEPVFMVNPHIIVFSNFLPIVNSDEISEIYTDIKILNENDKLVDAKFKVEDLI